ncbi:MAG: formylglycine-generating enzyme family protein [Opitutaceae bacterium]|nr:formylglycine-generating enzyme family protein [Opitutaceae bacterium]
MKPAAPTLLACLAVGLAASAALLTHAAPAESAAGAAPVAVSAPAATPSVAAARPGMILIPAGEYLPLLRGRDEPERVQVPGFWLDARPVTNAEFLAFVRAQPKWSRSRVSPLFADKGYLGDWAGDLELGANVPAEAPVVRVSWFAARAYAAWAGKRLPKTAEWERAAAAGFEGENGMSEPAHRSAALGWFSKPSPARLPPAGSGRPNVHGVRDLLTLVWEWVDDFNTAMVTGESRADTGLERTQFCGAGSVGARDLTNYPAFMRAGMRSSLRASYVVGNLGFRCVADATAAEKPPLAATGETVAISATSSSISK